MGWDEEKEVRRQQSKGETKRYKGDWEGARFP